MGELFGRRLGGQLAILRQVGERVEGKEARAAERIVGREDRLRAVARRVRRGARRGYEGNARLSRGWQPAARAHLHVLPLVLELRWHLIDDVSVDGGVRLEQVGQDTGATTVKAYDEYMPFGRHRIGLSRAWGGRISGIRVPTEPPSKIRLSVTAVLEGVCVDRFADFLVSRFPGTER